MLVRLEVSDNKSKVKRITLQSDVIIGRSSDCNLRIASNQVSRHHCKIIVTPSQVRVMDLGSANGTFLNGELLPANKQVPISSGAQISIGPARFVARFEIPPEAVGAPASTKEIPIVPEGMTAAEALAAAETPSGKAIQPLGGAVAGAIAAAAKAQVQAPQQIEEWAESGAASEAAEEPPTIPHLLRPPLAEEKLDDTVDWAENAGNAPPVTVRAATSTPAPEAVPAPLADLPDFEVVDQAPPAGPFAFVEPAAGESPALPETEDSEYEYEYEEVDGQEDSEDVEYEYEYEYVEEQETEEPPEAEADSKKGKLGSLFGIFGRKKRETAAPSENKAGGGQAQSFVEPDEEDETAELPGVPQAPPAGAVSEDDAAAFLADVDSDQPIPRGDEGDLGEFLKQFDPS